MPSPEYVITLDSHDYYGPFASVTKAMEFVKVRGLRAVQITTELPSYAKDQLQRVEFPL